MRLAPLAVLSLFVVVDLAANWHLGRMISVSEQVWWLEDRFGWWARVAVAIVFAPLLGHLLFRWPYGPG